MPLWNGYYFYFARATAKFAQLLLGLYLEKVYHQLKFGKQYLQFLYIYDFISNFI